MLHLQVSHLKIPIHYIVYGKITPFTDQHAMFLSVCPALVQKLTFCIGIFCNWNVVKDCSVGVFLLLLNKFVALYTPQKHIHPCSLTRFKHGLQGSPYTVLSTVDIIDHLVANELFALKVDQL